MRVQLWEWTVEENLRSNPVGVSMTHRGAMVALSRALAGSGCPGHGAVGPVVLVDGVGSGSHYLRFPVTNTAVFDEGVIRWLSCLRKGRQQGRSGAAE